MNALVLGQPLAHTFLALTAPEGVVSELHAGALENGIDTKLSPSADRTELALAFASVARLDTPLRIAFKAVGIEPDVRLTFRITLGQEQYAPEKQVAPIKTGTPQTMAELWTRIADYAHDFNTRKLPYNRFGWDDKRQNCQTALAWVLARTNLLPQRPAFKFAVPGWRLPAL